MDAGHEAKNVYLTVARHAGVLDVRVLRAILGNAGGLEPVGRLRRNRAFSDAAAHAIQELGMDDSIRVRHA